VLGDVVLLVDQILVDALSFQHNLAQGRPQRTNPL
jgi:hypothetical protein